MVEATDYRHEYVDGLWERTGGDHPLRIYSNFQELVDSIPNRRRLIEAIPGGRKFLVCVEDRLLGIPSLPTDADYVHMAGEGILNSDAVKDLKAAGIAGIIPHRDCGAKAIYARGFDQTGNPDDIGLVAVRALAEKVGVSIVQIVDADELATGTHYARAAYYDVTEDGVFNWSKVPGMPPGFVVSRRYISDPEYAKLEADISVGIALGEHGFGPRFTTRTPFYLVAVCDSTLDPARMSGVMDELGEVASKHQAVVVDSMLVR